MHKVNTFDDSVYDLLLSQVNSNNNNTLSKEKKYEKMGAHALLPPSTCEKICKNRKIKIEKNKKMSQLNDELKIYETLYVKHTLPIDLKLYNCSR